MLSFFPRDVLGEILDLIESVSVCVCVCGGVPTYSSYLTNELRTNAYYGLQYIG